MRKIIAVLMMLSASVLLISCSISPSQSSSSVSDKPNVINQKAKTDKAKEEYNNKVITTKSNFLTLRTQTEDSRLSKRNTEMDAKETSRKTKSDALIKQYSDEIEARHTENLKVIEQKYTNAKASIAVSGQDAATQKTDQDTASLQYSQAIYNENNSYANNKVKLDRLQRQYDTKIQEAQTTRNSSEDTFKKQCTSKYDDSIEKLDTISTGSGSQWNKLLNAEQKELTDYYTKEDKTYDDSAATLYSWFQDELSTTFK